jgi:hypothetical protein
VTELEGGDVGATQDLVVCVHIPAHAVGAGILDLVDVINYLGVVMPKVSVEKGRVGQSRTRTVKEKNTGAHFYF